MSGLTGFGRPQGGRRGGVRRLWLVRAADFAGITPGDGPHECEEVLLREGASFAQYCFREDDAVYGEEVIVEGGAAKVAHELSFALPRFDSHSAAAMAELIGGAPEGVIALMVTGGGDAVLAGYSELFGVERALKIAASVSSTGNSPADVALRRITLRGEDTSPALTYTGELPRG